MTRLTASILLILIVVVPLYIASRLGDTEGIVISPAAVQVCPKLNPCAVKSCEVKVDTRSMT